MLILYGITGLFAEVFSFGPLGLINAGFWIMVYGLMVYIPANALPERNNLVSPNVIAYLKAIIIPFLYAIPVAIIVGVIHPTKIHFT